MVKLSKQITNFLDRFIFKKKAEDKEFKFVNIYGEEERLIICEKGDSRIGTKMYKQNQKGSYTLVIFISIAVFILFLFVRSYLLFFTRKSLILSIDKELLILRNNLIFQERSIYKRSHYLGFRRNYPDTWSYIKSWVSGEEWNLYLSDLTMSRQTKEITLFLLTKGVPIGIVIAVLMVLISSPLIYNERALLIRKVMDLLTGRICEDSKVSVLELLLAFVPNTMSTKELQKLLIELQKRNRPS
jgi:hypothetical protein